MISDNCYPRYSIVPGGFERSELVHKLFPHDQYVKLTYWEQRDLENYINWNTFIYTEKIREILVKNDPNF